MGQVTIETIKALREQTGLPMMECKRALQEADGDMEKAIELLRKSGQKMMAKRADRETAFGRIGMYSDYAGKVSTMVELLCESAPVAKNDEFVQLADDMARQLAVGPGAASGDELLDQPNPSAPETTLRDRLEEVMNRIREKFSVGRLLRIDGPCGSYLHHDGSKAALVEVEGDNAELARDVCMHVVAARPVALNRDQLDSEMIEKERHIVTEQTLAEGKPEKVVPKIVEGRMNSFFAQHCLLEQPYVKDSNQSVGDVAKAGGLQILRFVFWEIGKE